MAELASPVDIVLRSEPAVSSRPYDKDPSITLHLTQEGKLAKITYPPEKVPTKERLKQIVSGCPLCKDNSKKLNNKKPLFKAGDRLNPKLKEIGIIYAAAHAAKLTEDEGLTRVDEMQGPAPLEQKATTWITIAATLLPPIAAYQNWISGDTEKIALVYGATLSTKLQDIARAAAGIGYSPRYAPLSQRQPAAPLPTGSTENLVPESPVAGF